MTGNKATRNSQARVTLGTGRTITTRRPMTAIVAACRANRTVVGCHSRAMPVRLPVVDGNVAAECPDVTRSARGRHEESFMRFSGAFQRRAVAMGPSDRGRTLAHDIKPSNLDTGCTLN